MKTIQSKNLHLSVTALALLLAVTGVQAAGTTYTAVTTGSWHVSANWSPNTGSPTNGDIAIIPSGKTMDIHAAGAYCTNTANGSQILVGGQLNIDAGGTALGDITISNGATLNGNYNGAQWTYAGNVTNNGAMTWTGGFNGNVTNLYSGAMHSPCYLSGSVSNGIAYFSGIYVNVGTIFIGSGQNTGGPDLRGGGALTNLGTIYDWSVAAPGITTLVSTNVGSTYVVWGGNSPASRAATFYNFTITNTTDGNFPTISSTVINGVFNDSFNGNGGNFPNNLLVGGFALGPNHSGNNEVVSSGNTMIINGTGGWMFNVARLTLNSGCTVYFTNGANGVIGGAVVTPFQNLFIGSNAVVTMTNLSTIASTRVLHITNGGTFNAVAAATGAGGFNLRAGGTLGIADANGITSTAGQGSVQLTGARIYESGASYGYIGTVAQVTGNQLPTTGTDINNLVVSNSAGVTMTGNSSVTNSLTVTAGTLDLAGTTMTLGANAAVFNSGVIKGSLTVGSGGKLASATPGGFATSVIATNLTMSTGSTINLNLGATATGANDLLAVSNTLTLNGTVLNLSAPAGGGAIDQVIDYTLVSAGSVVGTPVLNWVSAPANFFNYTLINSGNGIKLHYGAAVAVGSLVFTNQPTSAGAGSTISPAVQVLVLDGSSLPLTNVTVLMSVSNAAATLNGTTAQVSDANGVATFNNLSINALGTYSLQAVAGTPSSTNYSTPFTISAGPAAKLAIQTPPSGTATAGTAFATQPVITVVDAFGNITSSNASVTVTANSGVVLGTTTVAASGGTATFSGLSLTNAGNITLTFASTGLASTSSVVAVSANTPAQLAFVTAPSATAAAGLPLTVQPVLAIQDAYGNMVNTNSSVDISASVGGVTGIHPVNALAGVATFSGLNLTNINSGNPITLSFTSAGVTGTNSTITLSGGTFAALAWTTLPVATYGSAFTTPPVLKAVDQYGNPTTNGLGTGRTVTVTLASGGGTLTGTTTYNIGTDGSNGVVTMTNLVIIGSGTNYQLMAALPSVGSPVSGMAVWLDGSDTNTITGTTSVTQWNDKSGNSRNFFPLGSGGTISNLTTINGRKVVSFPGGTGQMMTNGAYTLTGSNVTFFIVVRPTSYTAWQGPMGVSAGGNDWDNTFSWSLDFGNNNQATLQRNNNNGVNGVTLPTANTAFVMQGGFDGALKYVGVVGTSQSNLVSSADTQGAFNANRICVGGRFDPVNGTGSSKMPGDVGEVLVYNSWLSATDRSTAATYLYNKWLNTSLLDISVTTPSFTVAQVGVSITNGLSVLNKFFDTSTTATLITNSTLVLSGVLPADSGSITLVTNGYIANFSSATAGTWPVTVTGLTLGGSQATNYSLAQPTNLSGSISGVPTYTAFKITGNGSSQAGATDALTITALNSDGSTSTNFSSPGLSLTFNGLGTAPDGSAATINGNPITFPVSVAISNGLGTISLVAHKAESSVTLNVTDGIGNSSSNAPGSGLLLNVSVSTDSAYRISAATGTPDVGVSNALTIAIVDQYQNSSTFTGNKNITFSGLGSSPSGASPSVNGTAFGTPVTISFVNPATAQLIATKVENSALLFATDGIVTTTNAGGASTSLSPTAGAAIALGISTQPSTNALAGVAFAQQPVIKVLDQYGNLTTSNALVTAAASPGTLQGTTTVTASSGTATFAGLSLTNTGSSTLTFTGNGLIPTNSASISVSGGNAVQLVWTTQPGSAVDGTVFGQQPVLRTADAFGNFSSAGLSATQTVSVSLSSGNGPLLGTLSYNIGTAGSNGAVSFSDLKINAANTAAVLTASTTLSPGTQLLLNNAPLWLDANNLTTVTTNGSGVVIGWNNLGTRGGAMTVGTAPSGGGTWTGPTFTANSLNGKPVMEFTSVSERVGNILTNTFSPALVSGGDIHLFLALRQPVNPSGNWSGFIGFGNSAHAAGKDDSTLGEDCANNGGTDRGGFRFFRSDGDASPTFNAPGQYIFTGSGINLNGGIHNQRPANNVAFVNAFYWSGSANSGNGAGSDNWVDANGNTWSNFQNSATSKGNFNITDFGLGAQLGCACTPADGPDWSQSMDIAEVVVFTNVLNASDSAAIFSYLQTKWLAGAATLSNAVSSAFVVLPANSASTVASSENPSGFGDGVTFSNTVTGVTVPTGNVIFYANGSPFSTNLLDGTGVATSIAITSLARGTNTITAGYAGDANFNGVTNNLSGDQVVTNHPPVAVADNFTRSGAGISMKLAITNLLANDTDADSDTAQFVGTSATTTNGGALSVSGGFVFVPAAGVADAFTYTIQDGNGGTNTGNVFITIAGNTGQQTSVTPTPSNATVVFYGIPTASYSVQRATNVGFTLGVSNFPPITVPSNGQFGVTDNFSDLGAVPSSAFYRLVTP